MARIKGISVLLLETPLTRSKYISRHTHTHTHTQRLTQTFRTFCTFAYKTNPSVPICIINLGDEDAHLYPDKKIGTFQEEKINLKDLQTNTSYESICEVEEGGWFL